MFRRLLCILQVFVATYVIVAVLFTTNALVFSPLRFILVRTSEDSSWSFWNLSSQRLNLGQKSEINAAPDMALNRNFNPHFLRFSGGSMQWNTSDLALAYGLGSDHPTFLDDDLFLSKAFSNSLHPRKIIPYFYRASGTFREEDVTITTIVTSNRFSAFSRLVERYQGPISVTIHVRNNTKYIRQLVNSLESIYIASKTMSTYVDVHLVIDSFDRQFNMWRNVARLFARTDYVMMLDVDFYICTDFRAAIRQNKMVKEKLREGFAAMVIPAFEYVKYSEGVDPSVFPKDKQALLSLVKLKRVAMFHASWAPGHNSTDYKRFYSATPGDVYKVSQYQSAYEPYVIIKREGPPWCDERFVGYGGNKAACHFEMYISGIAYYVLSDHFIIHQNHRYEEVARKNERKHNRKIYQDFKVETCLRYLKRYHDRAMMNTPLAYNAQQECKNIKRVARIAAEFFKM